MRTPGGHHAKRSLGDHGGCLERVLQRMSVSPGGERLNVGGGHGRRHACNGRNGHAICPCRGGQESGGGQGSEGGQVNGSGGGGSLGPCPCGHHVRRGLLGLCRSLDPCRHDLYLRHIDPSSGPWNGRGAGQANASGCGGVESSDRGRTLMNQRGASSWRPVEQY
jgi:hypothetical protein